MKFLNEEDYKTLSTLLNEARKSLNDKIKLSGIDTGRFDMCLIINSERGTFESTTLTKEGRIFLYESMAEMLKNRERREPLYEI